VRLPSRQPAGAAPGGERLVRGCEVQFQAWMCYNDGLLGISSRVDRRRRGYSSRRPAVSLCALPRLRGKGKNTIPLQSPPRPSPVARRRSLSAGISV
jgi:hypothetical protein